MRGFPIRTSTDRSLVGSSPWLIAATHVLHRLQAPRHPPLALCSLEIFKKLDARARYGVLKGLSGTPPALPGNGTGTARPRSRHIMGLPRASSRASTMNGRERRLLASDRLGVHDLIKEVDRDSLERR